MVTQAEAYEERECAARAAGWNFAPQAWWPLGNDMEAYALASAVGMTLMVSGYTAQARCGRVMVMAERDDRDTDPTSHVRRAIWLAAVAVGKRIKKDEQSVHA